MGERDAHIHAERHTLIRRTHTYRDTDACMSMHRRHNHGPRSMGARATMSRRAATISQASRYAPCVAFRGV